MELTPEMNPFVESNLLANARITGEQMANMLNDWTQELISCTFASIDVGRGAKGLYLSMGEVSKGRVERDCVLPGVEIPT